MNIAEPFYSIAKVEQGKYDLHMILAMVFLQDGQSTLLRMFLCYANLQDWVQQCQGWWG